MLAEYKGECTEHEFSQEHQYNETEVLNQHEVIRDRTKTVY